MPATSVLSISWQHLDFQGLLVCSVYRFHVHFPVRIKLHDLGISLPHVDSFSKAKNSYIKSAYYSICGDYGFNADETWLNRDWFYTAKYGIFDDGKKATATSPPDVLTRWIIFL